MRKNYKLELSSTSLRNWNDGMMEYWNDGMAPFGQINAYGGDLEGHCFYRHFPGKRKNYKLQITNKKTKGGHGLHKGSSRLQTMTAFNKKLLQGVQGDGFLEKSPPGRRRQSTGGENARGH